MIRPSPFVTYTEPFDAAALVHCGLCKRPWSEHVDEPCVHALREREKALLNRMEDALGEAWRETQATRELLLTLFDATVLCLGHDRRGDAGRHPSFLRPARPTRQAMTVLRAAQEAAWTALHPAKNGERE
jgi:hypothetical protein